MIFEKTTTVYGRHVRAMSIDELEEGVLSLQLRHFIPVAAIAECKGSGFTRGPQGRFKITVEFEPEET